MVFKEVERNSKKVKRKRHIQGLIGVAALSGCLCIGISQKYGNLGTLLTTQIGDISTIEEKFIAGLNVDIPEITLVMEGNFHDVAIIPKGSHIQNIVPVAQTPHHIPIRTGNKRNLNSEELDILYHIVYAEGEEVFSLRKFNSEEFYSEINANWPDVETNEFVSTRMNEWSGIANTIFNRVDSKHFRESTFLDVIYKEGQYDVVRNGTLNKTIPEYVRPLIEKAVQETIDGYDPTGGAQFYCSTCINIDEFGRANNAELTCIIGKTAFFKSRKEG